jgi:hypothetical protein
MNLKRFEHGFSKTYDLWPPKLSQKSVKIACPIIKFSYGLVSNLSKQLEAEI